MTGDPLPATCRCRARGIVVPLMPEKPEHDPIKSKRFFVTPAEAGVQGHRSSLAPCSCQGQALGSRFRGSDDFIRSDRALVTAAGPIVSVEDLRVRFVTSDATVHAVNGISFTLEAGRVLGILGESGSGKSVTLRAMIGLLPPHRSQVEGRITVAGHEITSLSEAELREVRGTKIAMIFQEPMVALDPVFTIGEQIAETIVRHEGASWADASRRALDLLEIVQIPIIVLLRRLQQELGMAVIFVTHDVGVAVEVSDRLAVMYAGRFVETGPTATLIEHPAHPYTAGLLAATVLGAEPGRRLDAIAGAPPDLSALPPGCAFAPRCR